MNYLELNSNELNEFIDQIFYSLGPTKILDFN